MSIGGSSARGRGPSGTGGDGAPIVGVASTIDLCDAVLGQVGRRNHLFGWLRLPAAGQGGWLPVDAYYPTSRLVVLCRELTEEEASMCAELVPEHGLQLLHIQTGDLDRDPLTAQAQLRRMLPAAPPRVQERRAPAPAWAGPLPRPAPATASQRRPGQAPTAPPQPPPSVSPGLLMTLALTLVIELYLGVTVLAVGGGHWLLAFGLALDVASRALGALAAHRAGSPSWGWRCALIGSPAAAAFSLLGEDGPVQIDPAPLAGIVSVAAMAAVVLSLLGMAVGI